jgi:hypothetical protein
MVGGILTTTDSVPIGIRTAVGSINLSTAPDGWARSVGRVIKPRPTRERNQRRD